MEEKENKEQWQWKESGTAWYGMGIYHMTLVVPSREPLLGKLIIPEDNPEKAYVERTELGKGVIHALAQAPVLYPEVQLLQYCLMPDHLHAILYIRKPMEISVRKVIRGIWQGAKKAGREYVSSIESELHSGIFTERPFIRPLSRRGQLQTMIRYVQMNPERLATKHLMPDLFCVQEGIEIAGRMYRGVGDADLLQRSKYMPVHVRHTMIEEAEHGDNKRLRDYMNGCVMAARNGAVMVSPFISPKEKDVMDVLLKEGLPFIYIADNGFRDYYKPQDSLFDAVAKKQVLILSPWEYDPHKKNVSRAECVEMNKMAEEICTSFISPESDSGLANEDN